MTVQTRILKNFISKLPVEENLVRLSLPGFGPAPEVLVYLYSFCLGWRDAEVVRKLLDRPLRQLEEELESELGGNPALSKPAASEYLALLRAQLEQTCAAVARKQQQPPDGCLRPDALLGDTTLREHRITDEVSGALAAVAVARRVRSTRCPWRSSRVFAVFAAARQQDVFNYFLKRICDPGVAEDLAQKTWMIVLKDLRRFKTRYRRKRGQLIAFVMHKARNVLLDHFRREAATKRRQSLNEANRDLLEPESGDAGLLFPDLDRQTRTAIQAQLLERLVQSRRPLHQILIFFLCRLLDWTPADILMAFSSSTLREVLFWVEKEFVAETALPRVAVRAAFKKLRARLKRRVIDEIRGEERQEQFHSLLRQKLDETRLGAYFPGHNPEERASKVVSAWSSVRKSLVTDTLRMAAGSLKELLEEMDLTPAKLRARKKSAGTQKKESRKIKRVRQTKKSSPNGDKRAKWKQWLKSSKGRKNRTRKRRDPDAKKDPNT